jgi:hypothetical protein
MRDPRLPLTHRTQVSEQGHGSAGYSQFSRGREMTTPQERLARMRKSFEKNRSVLTVDYKYFITPAAPSMPRGSMFEHIATQKRLVKQPDKHGMIN